MDMAQKFLLCRRMGGAAGIALFRRGGVAGDVPVID